MSNQLYIVIEQTTGISRQGGTITTIKLVGLADRKEYRTYVSPSYRNYKNWQTIVNNSDLGFILTNCQIKDPCKQIISADSRPKIVLQEKDRQQLIRELKNYWLEQDMINQINKV